MPDIVTIHDPPKESPHDGWHGNLHIHAPPRDMEITERATFDVWPKRKFWPRKRRRVFTDCCACWMDPSETTTRGFHQEWYGWTFTHRCATGHGCDANPRKKCGAYLRQVCHDGY